MKRLFFLMALILALICSCGCSNGSLKGESSGFTSATTNTESNQDGGLETVKKPTAELPDERLISSVASYLDVPYKETITYKISEKFYLEEAQTYCKNVVFYEDGNLIASACVDVRNGKPMRNINKYGD